MQSSSVLSTLCGLYQQSLPLPSALQGNLSFRLSPVRIPMSQTYSRTSLVRVSVWSYDLYPGYWCLCSLTRQVQKVLMDNDKSESSRNVWKCTSIHLLVDRSFSLFVPIESLVMDASPAVRISYIQTGWRAAQCCCWSVLWILVAPSYEITFTEGECTFRWEEQLFGGPRYWAGCLFNCRWVYSLSAIPYILLFGWQQFVCLWNS